MLGSLNIKNFALIDDVEITFDSGLNVITGETGAGKSIIIGAIQLLVGRRADKSLIRKNAERCEINGIFEIGGSKSFVKVVNRLLEDAGIPECEDGQLILTRIIRKKSVNNFVNSSPSTLTLMNRLGDLLVDIHGPYDNQSLLRPKCQLDLLDDFGELRAERDLYRDVYNRYLEIQTRLDQARNDAPTPDHIDILRRQVDEIRSANVREDEENDLRARHRIAANSQLLLELLERCRQHIECENGILERLSYVMRELLRLSELVPDPGERFAHTTEAIIAELQAMLDELTNYAGCINVDASEISQMEERLACIQKLRRKYGGSVAEVLDYARSIEVKLSTWEDYANHLETLESERNSVEESARLAAQKLSRKRRRQAGNLSRQITNKLIDLGFTASNLRIECETSELSPAGADRIEFQFAPNPGEGGLPLSQIASSGEISRVMLAIKTILADADRIPLLIFDEIDVNIGGKVATVIGRELRGLGRRHQVICISHLPQIAAAADRHISVEKTVLKGRTSATIRTLDGRERIEEIGRMLGGAGISSVVEKHARELIANVCGTPDTSKPA